MRTIEEIITDVLNLDVGLLELKVILEEQEELASLITQQPHEVYLEEIDYSHL